jgi:hypothetical protein
MYLQCVLQKQTKKQKIAKTLTITAPLTNPYDCNDDPVPSLQHCHPYNPCNATMLATLPPLQILTIAEMLPSLP